METLRTLDGWVCGVAFTCWLITWLVDITVGAPSWLEWATAGVLACACVAAIAHLIARKRARRARRRSA